MSKNQKRAFPLFGLIVLVLVSNATYSQDIEKKAKEDGVQPPKPIQKLVEAFNLSDPEKMGSCVSDKCQVWYVGANGAASLGSKTRKQLVEQMGQYFKNIKEPRSKISDVSVVGRFVTAKESVSWQQKQKTMKQYSLVVFELTESKKEIARVWYYPAQK